MARAAIIVTIAVLVFAGAGGVLMRLVIGAGQWPALLSAAGIAWVAALAGASALWFVRGASQASVAQAALVATMLHLMLCVVAAAVVTLGKVGAPTPFLYWLLAFYWLTLIVLVVVFVRAVKSAPLTSATGK